MVPFLPALLGLPLLHGCTGTEPQPPSGLREISAGPPASVLVAPSAGTGPVSVPIILVDASGVAVAGSSVELGITGPGMSLQATTIPLDTTGHGLAVVNAEQPGAFTLTVRGSADGAQTGASAQGVVLGAPTPSLALDTVLPLPAGASGIIAMARGTGGLAVHNGTTIWWMPSTQGTSGWPVFTPSFGIDGMRAVEVDADGVRDLLVWGGATVVLLRGRAGGGFTWGAGWESDDMTVTGASVADIDGDLHGDLVIGLTGVEDGRVELLRGDGVWGFVAESPLALEGPIDDLVAADEDEDGRPDVTVLDAISGWLHRYTQDEDGWVGSSPPHLDRYSFPAGSELLAPSDLDGDGIADIIGLAAPGSGAQSIVFYILDQDEKYEQSYPRIWADLVDVDRDGATDVLMMEDGILHRIRFDAAAQSFIVQSYAELSSAGPMAGGDSDGDGIADIAVLTEAVVLHHGLMDQFGSWSVGNRQVLQHATGLTEDFHLHDVDGDGDQDIVGFVSTGGVTSMQVWMASWNGSQVRYTAMGATPLDATGRVLDLAHCDPDWYVLADNAEGGLALPYKAFRFRIEEEDDWRPVKGHGNQVSGTMLTCGTPSEEAPANRRIVVSDEAGHWTLYDYQVLPLEEGELGPVQDILLADPDGDGLDELFSCSSADCELLGADLDGDGADEIVRDEETVTLEGWGQSLPLDLDGRLSLGDADGDGVMDIIASDSVTRRVVVLPTLSGALAPPVGWVTNLDIAGSVRPTDYDGDGRPELVWRDDTVLVGTERSVPPDAL